jgi:hypothetical protein
MAETNEYILQALWWKRILSAFTDRDNHQAIPYVLELLRSLGDQRATETAHQARLNHSSLERDDIRRFQDAVSEMARRYDGHR